MKMTEFRPAYIKPLLPLSVWIAAMSADDDEYHFHKHYIMDDYGNPVEIKPLSVYGFEKAGIRPYMHH